MGNSKYDVHDVVDGFAAGGGASLGIVDVGLTEIGIEWDAVACKTREAAGLDTLHADISKVAPEDYYGVEGKWDSPPCEGFSQGGLKNGHGDAGRILEHIAKVLEAGEWVDFDEGVWEDPRSHLVLEPLRWALLAQPRWVVWEQVPFVLAIWEACRPVLEDAGYHVWTGKLHAEQYGVAQARERAYLLASLDGPVDRPPPTHSRYHRSKPERLDEGVLPWITMAEALGPDYVPVAANEGTTAEQMSWVYKRPSVTMVGSFAPDVAAAPGYRKKGDPPRQKTPGSVRLTLEQAAVLQGFPADHPFQGNDGEKFRQVGDAVPPLVASHAVVEAARPTRGEQWAQERKTALRDLAERRRSPRRSNMPRGRRAAAKPLTLGIAGSGELDKKAIVALLDDITEGQDVKVIYIPVTTDDFTDAVEVVLDWAEKNEHRIETVSDDSAQEDADLKEIVDGAEDDFDAGESAGKAIVELLTSSDDEVVENPKLLMFFDAEEDEDVAVFEAAHEAEVPAFDLRDSGSPISFGDDEPAPDPEPEPEAPKGRRGRKAAAEEPAAEEPTPAAAVTETREELLKLTLVELKRKAKDIAPDEATTASLKGLDKAQVIDTFILPTDGAQEPDEPADEAQAEPTTRRRRQAAQEPAEEPQEPAGDDDSEAEAREAVFARLRGQREEAERITRTIIKVTSTMIDEASEEGGDERAFEIAAAAVAGALMVFADFIVTEVRKPKSAGRPRKDGTEAQPRPPADPAAPPKRRGRPRKDAS